MDVYSCSKCSFEFHEGWGHHDRATGVLCLECGQQFRLKGALSEWGPSFGETLSLQKLHESDSGDVDWQEFDQSVTVEKDKNLSDMAFINTKELVCPDCNTKGRIVLEIEEGTSCPKCKEGVISISGFWMQ